MSKLERSQNSGTEAGEIIRVEIGFPELTLESLEALAEKRGMSFDEFMLVLGNEAVIRDEIIERSIKFFNTLASHNHLETKKSINED